MLMFVVMAMVPGVWFGVLATLMGVAVAVCMGSFCHIDNFWFSAYKGRKSHVQPGCNLCPTPYHRPSLNDYRTDLQDIHNY